VGPAAAVPTAVVAAPMAAAAALGEAMGELAGMLAAPRLAAVSRRGGGAAMPEHCLLCAGRQLLIQLIRSPTCPVLIQLLTCSLSFTPCACLQCGGSGHW
jgi:hypothetical protein